MNIAPRPTWCIVQNVTPVVRSPVDDCGITSQIRKLATCDKVLSWPPLIRIPSRRLYVNVIPSIRVHGQLSSAMRGLSSIETSASLIAARGHR